MNKKNEIGGEQVNSESQEIKELTEQGVAPAFKGGSFAKAVSLGGWVVAILLFILVVWMSFRLKSALNEVAHLTRQVSQSKVELAQAAWQLLSPARRELTYASFSFDPELYTPHQVIEYIESARPWINLAREIVPDPKHAEQLSNVIALLDDVKDLLSRTGQQEEAQRVLNKARDIVRSVMGELQRVRSRL
ncbi:MAG: hypothetical protein RUDDFDWM_001477 [Candidatus Fervidibacterota bacterium]